jgi:hypothetical protein
MAFSYPLTLATFADTLMVRDLTFHLPEVVQMTRTAGGEQLTADIGERLWQGRITLGRMTRAEVGSPEVLIDLLRQAGRSFLIYDRYRTNPLLDPAGTILGAASVTILALGGDARELSLAGLPAGYTLSAGDYLSFDYGSAPVRRALHRVVPLTVVANGSGQTPIFEITPALRPGASAGAAVSLKKAWCKAVMVAGSINAATRESIMTDGLAFDFVQTLR